MSVLQTAVLLIKYLSFFQLNLIPSLVTQRRQPPSGCPNQGTLGTKIVLTQVLCRH